MRSTPAFTIYLLINGLIVYKYAARVTENSALAAFVYMVTAGGLIWLLWRRRNGRISDSAYFSTAAVLAVLLTILMKQFDPAMLHVGRYAALHEWITRLLNGQFPYASDTYPSGFPFLFALALPFYFLGDLGLFQIFSFLVFAWLIHRWFGSGSSNRLICLGLLVASPLFLYEIVTRSDLFSNMVVVLLYLTFLGRFIARAEIGMTFLWGLGGGLILATRGIVLPILLVAFGYLYRRVKWKTAPWLLGIATGFCLMLAPFAFWDWEYLLKSGPFALQTSFAPGWVAFAAILASAICGWRVTTFRSMLYAQAGILFGAITVALTLASDAKGWPQVIFGDGFDLSYFSFCLPFLVAAVGWPDKAQSGSQLARYHQADLK
jgi:hypothetical protein